MNRKWIPILIIIASILGLILAIKFVPVWITILNVIMFSAGFISGYLLSQKKNL